MGAQVSQVTSASEKDISNLLQEEPGVSAVAFDFHLEQKKDPELETLLAYLERGELPADHKEAQKVTAQALHFAVASRQFALFCESESWKSKTCGCSSTPERKHS